MSKENDSDFHQEEDKKATNISTEKLASRKNKAFCVPS